MGHACPRMPGPPAILDASAPPPGPRPSEAPVAGPWNRIPLLVRGVVGGVGVSFAGALFWVWLWRANLDSTPRFPWALGAMAIFLVLYVWYLSGHGWPKGTAAARAEYARGFPTRKVWIWGLLAALAGAL